MSKLCRDAQESSLWLKTGLVVHRRKLLRLKNHHLGVSGISGLTKAWKSLRFLLNLLIHRASSQKAASNNLIFTISGNQSKSIRRDMKEENLSHNQEKNQSIEIGTEMAQMIESVNWILQIYCCSEKKMESMSMVRRELKDVKRSKSNF